MRFAVLLAVGVGVGCTNLSYRPPAEVSPSPALTATVGSRVTLADARQRWERRPFDNGFELADLDALRPDPWAVIRQEVEASGLPAGPAVAVAVQSFRVVIHDPNRLQAEKDELDRLAGLSVESEVSFAALLTAPIRLPAAYILFGKKYPAGVTKDGPGVTCSLAADVTLTWPDGRTRTATVSAVRNVDNPAEGGRKFWGDDIRQAVAEAAADFGRQVLALVQTGPGG